MASNTNLAHVAVPIFTVDVCIVSGNEALMFRRSLDKKVFPGWLALPGGHIEEGEDALMAAIREVKEETGIHVEARAVSLKFVAFHHHLDRNELFIVFGYKVEIPEKNAILEQNSEGTATWMGIQSLLESETVFPPVRHYFAQLFGNTPGILYNYSVWNNAQLVRVLSEHFDATA